ncbi:MAG: ribosomal-processing cysteine protease Prp [Clostridia bacterium]|nr:ribosomal-processing cysteine protease Prp [Clostridia bacterium]
MTKFVFYKRHGVYYKVTEHGHSGYGNAGDDIVCSALSAMTMLVINTLEVSFGSDVDYKIEDDTATVTVTALQALEEYCSDEKLRYAIHGVLQGYFLQLNDMLEEYYDYIDVDEVEECNAPE